ncbi:hypothetical protein LOTGIDRAFT_233309 [Lottia gigantea]|uniref:BRCT domain-containing protein n=1 Tax=Lottia gigantea TaxID=225164 RepID=V3ZL14_LOTGI|nr:hypothetical protein LOTGIDRAFT_233309 [Lottia gigantea]ESO92053.1 hypothetical protein LOTGIDRAFT_233309 [Lottia gigantea]
MAEVETVIKCVRSSDENSSPVLEEAFETMQSHKIKTEWISQEKCMEYQEKARNICFIFDPFEGEAFAHLSTLGFRIIGPQCILSNLLMKMEIPKRRSPIYNLAMKDLKISCSNIDKDQRAKIYDKIELMGGSVFRDFTDVVTHLVAGEVGSYKYSVAASLKKDIMSPEWVQAVWEKSRYRHVHASDDIFSKYRCPVFKGFNVTVSGLTQSLRLEVKHLIESEGGKFSGEMTKDSCTHLVTNEPKGRKYAFAVKWKIHTVTIDWVYQSVETGYCQPEKEYSLLSSDNDKSSKSSNSTSTPTKDISRIQESHLGDISEISNASILHGHNMESVINSTRLSFMPDETTVNINIDLNKTIKDFFLDGLKIYLSGFRNPILDKLRKIVNAGGATRFNNINESVTHVILGEHIDSDINLLKSGEFRPFVVSCKWLVDCYKQEKQLDESDYLCLNLPVPQSSHSPQVKSKTKARQSKEGHDSTLAAAAAAFDDEMDILSQYLPNQDNQNNTTLSNNDDTASQQNTTIAHQPDLQTTQEPSTYVEGKIFSGKKLIFLGFDNGEQNELIKLVEDNGGKMIPENKRVVADYGVVPLLGFPVTVSVTEVVTYAWVQMCLEEERLLDTESNTLFKPLDITDSKPLQGCVLSVSGYAGVERSCIIDIADMIGAKCQDFFVRRPQKGYDACSHLIVNEPGGPKYNAANKWKVPALSKEWIYACATTGKRLPEENFLIDDLWNKNSAEISALISEPQPKTVKEAQNPNAAPKTSENPDLPNGDVESSSSKVTVQLAMNNRALQDNQLTNTHQNEKRKSNTPLSLKPKHSRIQELKTPSGTPGIAGSHGTPQMDTPSKFANSGVDFIPKFELDDIMKSLESPPTKRRDSFDVNGMIEKALELGSLPGESCASRSETFRSVSSRPLYSVTIYVSKKVAANVSQYHDIVSDLGGEYQWKYTPSCTHVIFQGRANDTNKEFRTARDDKKCVVSSHWLFACQEQQTRVDETLYPHNYNPKLCLNVKSTPGRIKSTPKQTPVRSSRARSTKTTNSQVKTVDLSPKNIPRLNFKTSSAASTDNKSSSDSDTAKHPRNRLRTKKSSSESEDKQSEGGRNKSSDRENEKMNKGSSTSGSEKENKEEKNEAVNVEEHEPEQQEVVEIDSGGTLEMKIAISKQLDDIMAAKSKKAGRRKSRKLNSSGGNLSASGSNITESRPSSKQDNRDEKRKTRSTGGIKNEEEIPGPSESQSVLVTWDDPVGRLEKEKLAAKLEQACSPTQTQNTEDYMADLEIPEDAQYSEVEDNHASTDDEQVQKNSPTGKKIPTPEAPPLAFPIKRKPVGMKSPVELIDHHDEPPQPQYVFLLSGMSAEEELYEWGGEVMKSLQCTCINNDLLYFRKSYMNGVEELYEWGGEVMKSLQCTCINNDLLYFRKSYMNGVEELYEWGGEVMKSLQCTCINNDLLYFRKSYMNGVEELYEWGGEVMKSLQCTCINNDLLYFRKSYMNGVEELYEWGGEDMKSIQGMSNNMIKLASAANRWRQVVHEMSKNKKNAGAFCGWKVILSTDKNKESNFSRLLVAGGAKVLSLKPPYPSDISATHAFLELHKVPLNQSELETLIMNNVLCLKPEFIPAHLTDSNVSPDEYTPTEISSLKAW